MAPGSNCLRPENPAAWTERHASRAMCRCVGSTWPTAAEECLKTGDPENGWFPSRVASKNTERQMACFHSADFFKITKLQLLRVHEPSEARNTTHSSPSLCGCFSSSGSRYPVDPSSLLLVASPFGTAWLSFLYAHSACCGSAATRWCAGCPPRRATQWPPPPDSAEPHGSAPSTHPQLNMLAGSERFKSKI